VQENQWYFFLIAVHNKTRRFICRLRINYAAELHFALAAAHHQSLVGNNAHRPAIDAGSSTDECFTVLRLVFIKLGVVAKAFQNFAHIVGFCTAIGINAIDFFEGQGRGFRFDAVVAGSSPLTKFVHQTAYLLYTTFFIGHLIIAHSRNSIVHGCTAQCFFVHIFSDSGFYQIRTCQKYRTRFFYNQGFIAHNRQISTARHTTAHNGRNLGNIHRRHNGVVAKNTSKMLFIRKNFILHR